MTHKKYYVVWVGRNPGVYDDWGDAREQIENFPGARFKSYGNSAEAAEAYRRALLPEERRELREMITRSSKHAPKRSPKRLPEGVDPNGWAVDAACSGNPGRMEYRGVDLSTGREIFKVGPFEQGTNNIGEFLAIVHAMALMQQRGETHTIYTDSMTGKAWVRDRRIKTTLAPTPQNAALFDLMRRALDWLNRNSFRAPIIKWETRIWGEIPADFGRK